MILEKNNLQTVREWTKSHIELIASYVHPKNSKYHLQSHLRAILAQDHSRLGMENKFLKNKSGQIFGVWQVLNFTKSCQQMWGHVNQPFVLFMHHIWGETYYEALFLWYRSPAQCSGSLFWNTNCTHLIFRTIKACMGF